MSEWIVVQEDELMHHGRKGQHWGVMNGPPYPLNAAGLKKFRDKVRKGATEIVKKHRAKKIEKSKAKTAKIREKKKVVDQKIREENAKIKLKESQQKEKSLKEQSKNTKAAPESKKSISELSDEEIMRRINRIQLENNYKKLLEMQNPPQTKSFMRQTMENTAKDMMTNAAKQLGQAAVNKMVQKLTGTGPKGKTNQQKALEAMQMQANLMKAKSDFLKNTKQYNDMKRDNAASQFVSKFASASEEERETMLNKTKPDERLYDQINSFMKQEQLYKTKQYKEKKK